jgi:predicted nucleic acid-binding protein
VTVFVDASALVKGYDNESQHAVVRSIAEPLAVGAIARVEVPSALWRKYRDRQRCCSPPAGRIDQVRGIRRRARVAAVAEGFTLIPAALEPR